MPKRVVAADRVNLSQLDPLSPTTARVVFEARGEIITVPAEKGDPRNLTNTTVYGY